MKKGEDEYKGCHKSPSIFMFIITNNNQFIRSWKELSIKGIPFGQQWGIEVNLHICVFFFISKTIYFSSSEFTVRVKVLLSGIITECVFFKSAVNSMQLKNYNFSIKLLNNRNLLFQLFCSALISFVIPFGSFTVHFNFTQVSR